MNEVLEYTVIRVRYAADPDFSEVFVRVNNAWWSIGSTASLSDEEFYEEVQDYDVLAVASASIREWAAQGAVVRMPE